MPEKSPSPGGTGQDVEAYTLLPPPPEARGSTVRSWPQTQNGSAQRQPVCLLLLQDTGHSWPLPEQSSPVFSPTGKALGVCQMICHDAEIKLPMVTAIETNTPFKKDLCLCLGEVTKNQSITMTPDIFLLVTLKHGKLSLTWAEHDLQGVVLSYFSGLTQGAPTGSTYRECFSPSFWTTPGTPRCFLFKWDLDCFSHTSGHPHAPLSWRI